MGHKYTVVYYYGKAIVTMKGTDSFLQALWWLLTYKPISDVWVWKALEVR